MAWVASMIVHFLFQEKVCSVSSNWGLSSAISGHVCFVWSEEKLLNYFCLLSLNCLFGKVYVLIKKKKKCLFFFLWMAWRFLLVAFLRGSNGMGVCSASIQCGNQVYGVPPAHHAETVERTRFWTHRQRHWSCLYTKRLNQQKKHVGNKCFLTSHKQWFD